VALTFHVNGDPVVCQQLFAEAKQLKVPLTLFLVGTWAQANPGLINELTADGHELANHTLTHPTLGRLGASAVATEITGCRDVLLRETGQPGRYFRPSGMEVPTDLVLAAAGAAGYETVVGYSIDPRDYQDPGAASVTERVRNALAAGAIVSMHTAHPGTVSAFGDIVDGIRNAGLHPATVSELLRT
jgi:peptidoglycan/xylan/chitin deacetylase (PgdA/CDA1 family)